MTSQLPSPSGQRIAIVSHVHPSISKGGAELSAYAVYQGLMALGHDAIFIAAVPETARERVALSSAREFAIYFDPTTYDHFYQLADPSIADKLVDLLKSTQTTIVNFQHFMNIGINCIRSVSTLPQIKTSLTLHEFLAICHNHGQMITRPHEVLCTQASTLGCTSCYPEHSGQQFAIRRRHFLDALSGVDRFISPSRFLAKRFVDWGLEAARMVVVENGLNLLPKPLPPRKRKSGDGSWVFGYFGQITPFKGLSTILDTADLISSYEELPEKITIRVHGNMVGQTEEFLRRFDQAVTKYPFFHYAGAYDNRTVSGLMGECDYIVTPSIWWENSPVVIQEAFAVGRPVICSGIGGMAEKVVDGVSGLHFRVRDHVDLLRAMETASTQQAYDKLTQGIPAVANATMMAQAYLDAGLSDHFATIAAQESSAGIEAERTTIPETVVDASASNDAGDALELSDSDIIDERANIVQRSPKIRTKI